MGIVVVGEMASLTPVITIGQLATGRALLGRNTGNLWHTLGGALGVDMAGLGAEGVLQPRSTLCSPMAELSPQLDLDSGTTPA